MACKELTKNVLKPRVDVPWNTMNSRDENVVLGFIFSLSAYGLLSDSG